MIDHLKNNKGLYYPLLIFLIFRILTWVWMWGVRQVISQPLEPHPVLRPYLGVAIEQNPWLEPWQRWDTLHYQAIAERGYDSYNSALFVPPLFPLLMRLVAGLTGGNTLLSGIILSNLAFLIALFVFYRLAELETKSSADAARALLYLASFPASFFFFAAYTESLFLLASLLALAYLRQEKWWQSGVWGAVAAFTRLPGALVVVPAAIEAFNRWIKNKVWAPWISVLLTLAGAALFPLYTWLILRLPPWTPWTVQEVRFKGGLSFPGINVFQAFQQVFQGKSILLNLIDIASLLFFLICLISIWRHLPKIYSYFSWGFMLLYLLRTSTIQPLLSVNRYVLVFFPAFIVMGAWGKNIWINRAILYLSWIGLLYLSGQFAIWGWAG